MKATDLDLEINESTAAMVEQSGATTVPAHLLYEIVRKLPDGGEVMLATNPDGTSMTVVSDVRISGCSACLIPIFRN